MPVFMAQGAGASYNTVNSSGDVTSSGVSISSSAGVSPSVGVTLSGFASFPSLSLNADSLPPKVSFEPSLVC